MKIRYAAFRPYMKPADDGGVDGGATTVDRGDEWNPTPDEPKPAPATPEAKETPPAPKDEVKDDKDEAKDDKDEVKGEKDDKKKDTRVPLSRHQEILARERERREALEREVAELKQGKQVAATNEQITAAEEKVVAMEADYMKLLAEGDVKGAAAKMAEIRKTERSIIEATARMETQAAEARAYERVRYDTTVERLEAAYPVINPDHDDFDKNVVAEVIELRDGYVATGKYSLAEALQKACKTLLKTETKRQETATTADVRVDKEDVAKAVREERKADAVKRNADVANKQPATLAGVGADSDKAGGKLKAQDVIKLDQKAFSKLAEADLSKLRGDEV